MTLIDELNKKSVEVTKAKDDVKSGKSIADRLKNIEILLGIRPPE